MYPAPLNRQKSEKIAKKSVFRRGKTNHFLGKFLVYFFLPKRGVLPGPIGNADSVWSYWEIVMFSKPYFLRSETRFPGSFQDQLPCSISIIRSFALIQVCIHAYNMRYCDHDVTILPQSMSVHWYCKGQCWFTLLNKCDLVERLWCFRSHISWEVKPDFKGHWPGRNCSVGKKG